MLGLWGTETLTADPEPSSWLGHDRPQPFQVLSSLNPGPSLLGHHLRTAGAGPLLPSQVMQRNGGAWCELQAFSVWSGP